MYRPEDLQAVDVRDYVRREQQRFFRGGQYNAYEAASMIALEALLAGAEDVRIHVVDGWIYICSEKDWLAGIEVNAFSGLAPFRPGGPNGVTAEFLVVVFSRSVATLASGEGRIVKGDSLGPLNALGSDWGRAIAFEIEASEVE